MRGIGINYYGTTAQNNPIRRQSEFMKTANKQSVEKRIDCSVKEVLSFQLRFWLLGAAFWLQAAVIAFVVVEIIHRVHTPVADWLSKVSRLLGM
jgi:uncharacterized membrane protein